MPTERTKADLEAEIAYLQEQNEELQDQLDAIADIVGGDEDDEDDEYADPDDPAEGDDYRD